MSSAKGTIIAMLFSNDSLLFTFILNIKKPPLKLVAYIFQQKNVGFISRAYSQL